MHAGPQKVVNRASPVVQRASNPVATTAGTGRAMQSPYATRFAGSITQREPQIGRNNGSPSDGGKRMYRTSDGSQVELPPDMTVEQAAGLEAESKAAQKQLGKGPPPKPVPDVKSLAKKAVKKGPAQPRARGKGLDRGRGKAAPKIGGTAAALFASVGKSTVAQYLAARGAPVLLKGVGMLQKLRQNEQTHDDATEKRQQSEQAVVIPPSEGQSKGNTGQVSSIGERPAPAIDEKAAKGKLQETLEANTPRSIEDVDNFQRDAKAQHVGADVMQVVQGDKNAVTSTFGEIEQTPAPVPPEHQPEALPPEEVAPSTPNLNLGQGAVAPLQKEHTETSHYTKEADSKLKEEGVTQEQLDMVDNGDLAEANKEKKGLEKASRTEPAAIQEFARKESANVDRELKQEEKKDRDTLKAKRKSGLNATGQKQKGAKSALEKKRDEVAGKINDIYKTAQDRVKKKLADLETQSMKRFDDGNAKATRAFEVNVKRELDAFKADRYSGFWGGLKRAKDWLLGMDDLPEVKAIFDRNRAAFVSTISKLVDDISADNKRVIQECKDELANAKKAIREYVDQLGPRLRDIGNKAAAEMNSKLDELDQFIGKKEAELQNKLKDKQTAAIKAIDQKIEKMKEAMSGALSKLGKLLLLAAKKFFTWALQKFGYSLADIEGIINRGAAVLKAIFTKPLQFVKNLMNAALTGFKNFGKNFLKHLKNALFEWLTGSLEGLVLPKTWDFPGIIGVALQMIGISYQNVRKHMVTVMGEPVVAGLEKTFTLVKTLVTEGPMAAWEQLKEMAAEMRDAFVEAVKDFIKIKIVEQAIQWLVSLLIPGAGIIKAIIGIYDTIVFFIQKAKQIAQMIANFLGSMGEIAAGNIGAAADAMESGLARGLSLVISFLAKLLRLDGITAKIREAIQKIRAKVDAVLLKVAKWIADKAKKLFTGLKSAVSKIFNWATAKRSFKDEDGKSHSLYVETGGGLPRLMIASDPMAAEQFLDWYINRKSADYRKDNSGKISAVRSAISVAKATVDKINTAQKAGKTDAELEPLLRSLLENNVAVTSALSALIDGDATIGKAREKYLLEGITGTYSSIPKPKGDELTADHQPQAAILQAAAEFDYFSETGELAKRAAGRAQQGFAINVHYIRHKAGDTYGTKGKVTKEQFLGRIKGLVKGKKRAEQRQAVVEEIRKDMKRDVASMKAVAGSAPTSPNWADVMALSGKKEDKEKLVKEIGGRIAAGQSQIAAQDIDSLVG